MIIILEMAKKKQEIRKVIEEELSQDQLYNDSINRLDEEQRLMIESIVEEFSSRIADAVSAIINSSEFEEIAKTLVNKNETVDE